MCTVCRRNICSRHMCRLRLWRVFVIYPIFRWKTVDAGKDALLPVDKSLIFSFNDGQHVFYECNWKYKVWRINIYMYLYRNIFAIKSFILIWKRYSRLFISLIFFFSFGFYEETYNFQFSINVLRNSFDSNVLPHYYNSRTSWKHILHLLYLWAFQVLC